MQLPATDPALRPRDLSDSARRDLAATLARAEVAVSGLDFLIPPAHFDDPARVGRAVDAAREAIELAARLGRAPVTLPGTILDAPEAAEAVAADAERFGVRILLAALETGLQAGFDEAIARCGDRFDVSLDCAAAIAAGLRPDELVTRIGARMGGVRIVDLLRSGLRGPLLEPGEWRLDALALRVALEVSGFGAATGGLFPVVDARQWTDPMRGLSDSLERWAALV